MYLNSVDLKIIETAALAKATSFGAVPDDLERSPNFITVTVAKAERKIPIVTEWRWDEADILVFNNLNSCLGIIGVKGTKVKGFHFSMLANADLVSAPPYDYKTNIESRVSDCSLVRSFGGSQLEWENSGGKKRYAGLQAKFPAIEKDENNRWWVFYVGDAGNLMSHTFTATLDINRPR